jgi:hypothetical protein
MSAVTCIAPPCQVPFRSRRATAERLLACQGRDLSTRESNLGYMPVSGRVFFMLRLYFLCANPTLARNSAVALTLRAVGGLTTRQIATACLVTEATMARRISRPSGGSRGCHSTSPAISGRCCACSTSSSMRGTAGNVDLAAEAIRLTRTAPCGATAGQSTLPELLCTSGQLREFRVHGFLMRSGRRRFRRAWRRRSLCLVGDWPAGGVAGPGRCHRHAPPIRWAGV